MKLLELTLPSTAQNLALDEVLLDLCESGGRSHEVLRLWENPTPAVILGRSSKVAEEINEDACRENDVPFFRRCSGGASVVIGPGCLMYAAVLDYRTRPELKLLDQAHQMVMGRIGDAIRGCGVNVRFQGTCDLTLDNRKFSGNSLRCQRNSFLYHGTLLYDFPLDSIQQYLGTPPRQPGYRDGRSHARFVTNLPLGRDELVTGLKASWQATEPPDPIDMAAVDELVDSKYSSPEWIHKR